MICYNVFHKEIYVMQYELLTTYIRQKDIYDNNF